MYEGVRVAKYSVGEMNVIEGDIKKKYILTKVNKIIKAVEENLRENVDYKFAYIYINHEFKYLDEIIEVVKEDVVMNGFTFKYTPFREAKLIYSCQQVSFT